MDYNKFMEEFFRITKLDLTNYKESQMKRRIDTNIKRYDCKGYADYLTILKTDKKALEEFMSYLTINVSEFFRNPTQWDILEKEILPKFVQNKRAINVWSAACSTGDEPYSLVMLLMKYFSPDKIKILATDIDIDILKQAKLGVYPDKQILNLPAQFKSKYFKKDKDKFIIDNSIKRCVEFKQHNLLSDPYPKNMDLIVCRNVLIYFTEKAKSSIYYKFSQALSDDGVLFVGSTEQIISSNQYNLQPSKVFFYQKIKK
ncbi:chemotaxis protein CheR [Candidatus Epulonipiscium fishelsonii]|uniref:Chemotaxis protein CheR n=1 Tax=Candidatus Epulonipiscium fishelsonii TaxID=77094 RepID=A0ACC8XAV9_9FIRM|nr:chemotaxis protein CheR [Epulopiscium sp. SCG-B05WGA-EpuloA1]ONI39483.1 chemotaxis protein CheR [Epulopiscium sp. SCG-B11WGA-EpuloA1]